MSAMAHLGLSGAFARRREAGQAALIPYVTAGFPSAADTALLLRGLADSGADILELGIPFSDPMADGPTIQASSFEALERGMTMASALELLEAFRAERDTPVIVFSYLNPVLRFGAEKFLERARSAGADGLLLTDLPVDADPSLENGVHDAGLALIRLIAPTTDPDRMAQIAAAARGFVYYVSRTGVTGARRELRRELASEVGRIRACSTVPVAVGFGISSPEQAASVADVADGVVVGSAVIEAQRAGGVDRAVEFVAELREAMDARH